MEDKYVHSDYLNLTFKRDTENVWWWWWSVNLKTWFPEMNIPAEVLDLLPGAGNPSK